MYSHRVESDLSAESGLAPTPRVRRRNPEASRAAILAAARSAFAENGYAAATIRDIARRAGVTHGLVMMHFTSKEQLFLAAVPGHRELADVVAGDPALFPERLAAAYVARMENGSADDPLVALLRAAAANVPAAARLYAAMLENSIELYREALPVDAPAARVELVGALMIGVTFSRYVVRGGSLARMSGDELREHLIPLLRSIVQG